MNRKLELLYQALLHALAAIGVASLVQAAHAAAVASDPPPDPGCALGRPPGPPVPR